MTNAIFSFNACTCFVVPKDVLERFANDPKVDESTRASAAESARLSDAIRAVRHAHGLLSGLTHAADLPLQVLAAKPAIRDYDCKNTTSLPGSSIAQPSHAADPVAKEAWRETKSVSQFFKTVFGRNSVDNAGMTLVSSVHYGKHYNNAFWNGAQMVYGDGDGKLFTCFTRSNDVIGHELMHGVTQYSLQLGYSADAGGLNESLSDCFGSMFRQWEADQDVAQADWLIGANIMGSLAKARGYTCLRDMANPANKAAMAAQPTHYKQLTHGMDPHYTSGPPNLAFATACKTLGGKSWERIGQVWYSALTTSGVEPNMTMPTFAARTRQLAAQMYSRQPAVPQAVDTGWKKVGL